LDRESGIPQGLLEERKNSQPIKYRKAHPNWMLTATPKGWHYNPHPIWMRLALLYVRGGTLRRFLCWVFLTARTLPKLKALSQSILD
jgi:hypothetical protein